MSPLKSGPLSTRGTADVGGGGGTRRFVGIGIPEQVHRVAAGARVGTFAADPMLGRTTHPEKQAQTATSLGWEMW